MYLPNELLLKIFRHLSRRDIKSVRCTSVKFAQVANILLFSVPLLKRKLRLSVHQISHLPFISIDNRFLKRFHDVDTFPSTTTTVILSHCRPIVHPRVISQFNDIQFYANFGYFYPISILHPSNYSVCRNFKIFSSPSSSMRCTILNTFSNFTFAYINISHIESVRSVATAVEEGLTTLSQLKVDRLALLESSWFNITAEQLLQLNNIVCICSDILPKGVPFPFKLLQDISTLEAIFLRRGVIFNPKDLEDLNPFSHSPYHYKNIDHGLARICTSCVICLRQPRSALGKLFTLTDSPLKWNRTLYQLYSSVESHAQVKPRYHDF